MSSGRERHNRERGGGRGRRGQPPVWAREPRGRARRTQPGSREEIVAAALHVADADGYEAISMRRVASELGVGTMTLYSYVSSKDDLLDLMFDEVMSELLLPEPLPEDWREALSAIARRSREVWLRHHWLTEGIGERSAYGPNSLRHVEQSLAAVQGLALDGPEAFVVLAAVDDYVLGQLMRQASQDKALGREAVDAEAWRHSIEPYMRELLETGEFPLVAKLADRDWEILNQDRFEHGLGWMLDGIAARYGR